MKNLPFVRHFRSRVAASAMLAACGGFVGQAAFGDESPGGHAVGAARIVRVITIPDVALGGGVRLGGLSDLAAATGTAATPTFWTLTDRGPNGSAKVGGRDLRTITAPAFIPTIVRLELPAVRKEHAAAVVGTIPLASRDGRPLSGRPPPGLADDPIVDPQARTAVAADPHGIDSEGLVAMPDGTFWIAEEYGPSLLHVSAEGRVMERFFPVGAVPANAGAEARDTLPAEYAQRRENRGFEALAAAPCGRVFALLQSPLDHPRPKAAKKTGNVRLLVFDPAAGRPAAEHVYRLGDPEDSEYLTRGAPPEDGKLCAIAAIADDLLLVLEQADGGLARLYAAALDGATDTLGTSGADGTDRKALEQVRDLTAAGIAPVRKRLVADLGGLLREIEAAVYDGPAPDGKRRQLKLEGLAILDDRTIAIVNDNDFGVHVRDGAAAPRSCLFVIKLPTPLPGGVAVVPRPAQNAGE